MGRGQHARDREGEMNPDLATFARAVLRIPELQKRIERKERDHDRAIGMEYFMVSKRARLTNSIAKFREEIAQKERVIREGRIAIARAELTKALRRIHH